MLAKTKRDAPRAAETRHVKLCPNVRVCLKHGDMVLETGAVPNALGLRAILALEPNEHRMAPVSELFRPGAHAVLAAALGMTLWLVWQSRHGVAILLVLVGRLRSIRSAIIAEV